MILPLWRKRPKPIQAEKAIMLTCLSLRSALKTTLALPIIAASSCSYLNTVRLDDILGMFGALSALLACEAVQFLELVRPINSSATVRKRLSEAGKNYANCDA
jgi:hypothetical protein